MLRRAIRQLRAQWLGALALALVLGGGTAYAAATIGSDDVIDDSLRSADLKNNIAVTSVDVKNGTLNDDDFQAGNASVEYVVAGTVQARDCVPPLLNHPEFAGDHQLMTVASTASRKLIYRIEYEADDGPVLIICNPTNAAIVEEGNFKVLTFDAQ